MLPTCQEHCGHFRALTNSLREALTLSARRAHRMYWIHASPARSADSCAARLEHSRQLSPQPRGHISSCSLAYLI